MRGAQLIIECLKAHGVTDLFGYPGGAIMPTYDAIYDSGLDHLLCRNEQGAAIAVIGYARSTGKVGVCVATSGPGATNLITGLGDAFADSVPLVAFTGQVAAPLIGTDAFQEADVLGLSLACTNNAFASANFNSESAVGFTTGLTIGLICSGTSLTWMLRGTSMRTGPGLPLCAIWKAEAIISGSSSMDCTM